MPTPDPARRWYLVRTQTGRERTAADQLRRQRFEAFLPLQMKTVRHARQLRVTTGAYFPAYLFVRLDLGRDRWRSINGTIGVAHLVGAGDRPSAAPPGVVEALIAAADAQGVIQGPPLEAGKTVRITAGAFADQLAVIQRLDGAGRVRVLLDIVAGRIPLDVQRAYLTEA